MHKISIRAFHAVQDRESSKRYLAEHAQVLKDIGVTSVIKPDETWMDDPDIVCVVAEHAELGMVAGIRLQRSKLGQSLPMERSLRELDPKVTPAMDVLRPQGNAELGALWNAHRFAGHGVPFLLISAAVSIANQIGLRSIVCLVAEYVSPYCAMNGFQKIAELGEKGEYVFPIPTIRSHAMVLPDVNCLDNAQDHERHRAFSLRLRPEQRRTEVPKQTLLVVTYDLLLDKSNQRYKDILLEKMRFAA